jgi:hypothetical protein
MNDRILCGSQHYRMWSLFAHSLISFMVLMLFQVPHLGFLVLALVLDYLCSDFRLLLKTAPLPRSTSPEVDIEMLLD